jgi:hypothetical protein
MTRDGWFSLVDDAKQETLKPLGWIISIDARTAEITVKVSTPQLQTLEIVHVGQRVYFKEGVGDA